MVVVVVVVVVVIIIIIVIDNHIILLLLLIIIRCLGCCAPGVAWHRRAGRARAAPAGGLRRASSRAVSARRARGGQHGSGPRRPRSRRRPWRGTFGARWALAAGTPGRATRRLQRSESCQVQDLSGPSPAVLPPGLLSSPIALPVQLAPPSAWHAGSHALRSI